MCTVVILRRPAHPWPLIIGANRDEMKGRPWRAPARHWPDRPNVVAGLDEEAGGTWMGLNDEGVVACILNRYGTLGGHPEYRSRGEVPLEALDHAEAEMAAEALANLNGGAYRDFNLVVGDVRKAYWIKNADSLVSVHEIPEGLSMLSSRDLNDDISPRIKRYLPLFEGAEVPDPDQDNWHEWQMLLGARGSLTDAHGAMEVMSDTGFETTSSSVLALAPKWVTSQKTQWKFAPGHPSAHAFEPVQMEGT